MIEEYLVARVRRLENWGLIICLVLMAVIGLSVWGFANSFSASDGANRASASAKRAAINADHLTRSVSSIAHHADLLAREISLSRKQLILANCRDQNHRHRATIREINQLIHRAEKHMTATQRRQVRTSRKSTLLIIDRLAPVQDCQRLVARYTSH